tara:strand:- start:64 stop:303 length:240 start_codon:yes stop_codon:yes gene_type:complete
MTSSFVNPNDPNIIPYGKGKGNRDSRWATCPLGQGFIVEISEEFVRSGKKRPTIPAAFSGKFRTKAIQQPWGYLVERIR